MQDPAVDLWALDEVHFQQQGSRCRMWVPPETKDPVVYHHPTRKSVGYFAAVRLRDGEFLFRRESGRFNGESFWEFLKVFREASAVAGRRVLDVGCSSGIITGLIASAAGPTVGIDVDEPALVRARAEAHPANIEERAMRATEAGLRRRQA